MNLKKYTSVIENSISLFLLKGIDLVLTIALIPFLIAKVGMHNYGVYVFVMSLVLFFVNVLNYGFNLSTVREVAKNRGNLKYINRVFNQVFSVKLFLFLMLITVFSALVFALPTFKEYKIVCFFSSFLLLVDLFSVRWFFYGMEKMKYITMISLVGNFVYVALVVSFVKVESDFLRIPLYESIGLGVPTFIAFVLVFKKLKFNLRLLSIKEVVEYLKHNFSSFVNLLLPSTYNLIVVFVVGLIGVPMQVSLMQIGVKFTAIFSTLINILSNVFYPILNRQQKCSYPMRYMLIGVGFLLSVIMFVFSEFIIKNWMQFDTLEALKHSVMIVNILSPVPFLTAIIAGFGVNGLLVALKDALFSKITFASTLMMLLSAFILVPLFPVVGAAMAFLMGKVVYAALVYVYYGKSKRVQ